MNDPYLERMLADLEDAECALRAAISNRNNPFSNNGPQRLLDCQANVDRLHELIRAYQAPRGTIESKEPRSAASPAAPSNPPEGKERL